MNQTAAVAASPVEEPPVLLGDPSPRALTEQILRTTWQPWRGFDWLLAATGAVALLLLGGAAYTVVTGVGVWGNNMPVAWGFAITNFVFWIGIGHAGTFISAFLLLLNQRWRASINRFAEAMTLFALVNAGLFPLLHLGRPWFAYWLVPYPSTMNVWPQFRSALPWDLFAVLTYLTVSALFWYVGLLPDLAALRDYAPGTTRRRVYGVFALGWRGSARQWHAYKAAYGLLAGLAAPLVVSVHTIVSFDFATTSLPGWHSTLFPPYFVAGAIFSGFAMVLTLLVPVRRVFRLHAVVTETHLDAMAKVLLATSWMVAYSYLTETVLAWRSPDRFERYTLLRERPFGDYAWAFWLMVACNVVVPQLLWWRRARRWPALLFTVSVLVNVGMWTERFVLISTSQARDFLPSSWRVFVPTLVDGAILLGTFGLFGFLFLLFLRFVPFVPLHEVKHLQSQRKARAADGLAHGAQSRLAVASREGADPHGRRRNALTGAPALLAEFDDERVLVDAIIRLRAEGGARCETFSPYPVGPVDRALGLGRSTLARYTLLGGVVGGAVGYAGQWWTSAVSYPLNVGGRPLHAVPAFVPITFELTMLGAALATVAAFVVRARLGRLWDPVDDVDAFVSASVDRFWLAVTPVAATPFDAPATADRLTALGATQVVASGGPS